MKRFIAKVNGNIYEVEIEEVLDDNKNLNTPIKVSEEVPFIKPTKPDIVDRKNSDNVMIIKSDIPGIVFALNFNVGSIIRKGDSILILEAMKMENEIYAPIDGKIGEIFVDVSEKVKTGDKLFSIIFE